MNPVVFAEVQRSDHLTIYSEELGEFSWKNRLVGVTDSGFLYVDERYSQGRYYNYYPKLLPWSEVVQVRTGRHFALLGFLLGVYGLFMAAMYFHEGWISRTRTGTDIVTVPILGSFGAWLCVLGAVRNRICVRSPHRTYAWISEPLNLRATYSICRDACERTASNSDAPIKSHVFRAET